MTDLRRERGDATRGSLVAAGRVLFGRRGYDATSIEAVLELAGVKRGALYHHFESKQALFDAVLDRVVSDAAEELREAGGDADDPLEALRAGCAAWIGMALDPGIQRIVLLDAPAVVGWPRRRELDERHMLGAVRQRLHEIADEGGILPSEVDLLAHMVVAAVNESALVIAGAGEPAGAPAKGRAAVNLLLDRLFGGARR
jgi:AcrR family transcriptional regulator